MSHFRSQSKQTPWALPSVSGPWWRPRNSPSISRTTSLPRAQGVRFVARGSGPTGRINKHNSPVTHPWPTDCFQSIRQEHDEHLARLVQKRWKTQRGTIPSGVSAHGGFGDAAREPGGAAGAE
eukprot:8601209-Pyramimonas_sp.AAC.1